MGQADEQVRRIRTQARRKEDALGAMSDGQVICRSMHRHDFPSDTLSPRSAKIPKGMSVTVAHDGGYQVTDTCTRCGKKRTYTTLPGALFDMNTHYSYRDPDDWVVIPEDADLGITGRDFKAEKHRRTADLLLRSALRPES